MTRVNNSITQVPLCASTKQENLKLRKIKEKYGLVRLTIRLQGFNLFVQCR